MTEYTYVGSELRLFSKAIHWKAYWRSQILQYVHGDVLEVGAGIGANTLWFTPNDHRTWTCLEPDISLCEQLHDSFRELPYVKVIPGVVGDLPTGALFDSILYIDVLEHIEDDHLELRRAAAHLRSGGHLIVLSPAHQWLFTPFDQAIGHCRRYSANALRAAGPTEVSLLRLAYLDSVGVLASLGNRLLLRQAQPSESQILVWDSYLVPVSRVLDRLLMYHCGKSLIGIWRKEAI